MIDNKRIFQVDAFSDEPFKGNPAGVMIIDETMTSEWMQNIAMEMNLSETAFIIPGKEAFAIRYFTPTREVPLCGHATLASSHIIYEIGLKSEFEPIEFHAQGGNLKINKVNDLISMNFPRYPIDKINIHEDFKKSLGFSPLEMYSSNYDWIIAIAENESDISNSEPNFELMKKNGLGHLMITAISDSPTSDFVVRCFAPISGINEDPVTGSAHCALTPLWAEKLGKMELDSLQLSKRTGRLKVKLINDRVEIKGKAITIFEAKIKI